MQLLNKKIRDTGHEYGFTLLEVMVAVFVLGVAAAAIVQASSSAIRHADAVTERQLAMWVANNTMAEAMLPDAPSNQQGESEFGGYSFHWQLRSEKTDTEQFQRLSVNVYRPGENKFHLAQLTGFRVTP